MRTNDKTENQPVDTEKARTYVLKKFIYKLFTIIKKEYDDNSPIEYSSIQNVEFYIDFKAPASIEILLLKYFAEELDIDNIVNNDNATV